LRDRNRCRRLLPRPAAARLRLQPVREEATELLQLVVVAAAERQRQAATAESAPDCEPCRALLPRASLLSRAQLRVRAQAQAQAQARAAVRKPPRRSRSRSILPRAALPRRRCQALPAALRKSATRGHRLPRV